jgi:PBSX family phage terminase large subunit
MDCSIMQKPYYQSKCKRCKYGEMNVMNDGNEWNLECTDCGAILFCYTPLPHQIKFHQDGSKYRMYAGGYGSGKTTTACADFIRLVLNTPNGLSLIGAATLPQLEQTAQKTFMEMIPSTLIKSISKQKNYVDLVNGHRILFRPLDDEGKAKSLNLCFFWVEESSEVGYDYFVQLQTRLRNHATTQHCGILSTNPDLGWIRQEFLLKSRHIHNSDRIYPQDVDEINTNYSTHIAPTSLNTYLPPTFYDDTAKGKPNYWIARYLDGSFDYSEGSVYPTFSEHIVEPFEIPPHWERFASVDFGLKDPTVMITGAVDPKKGIVYIYKEHYEANKAVPYHAEKMNDMIGDIPSGKLRPIVADPSGQQRSKHDKRSLFDHYAEYGLYFKSGNNRIDSGIHKVYAYFELGRLKIFSSLKNTIKEGINYKYKTQELASDKNADEKPVDKDNHSMDTLRYLVQELPDDPSNLINYSVSSLDKYTSQKQTHLPYALQDDDEHYGSGDWVSYY